MAQGDNSTRNGSIVPALYLGLDVVTAILLLTGQIAIGGVFITHDSFGLSLSGPFTGSGSRPSTPQSALVLDGLDVITALLLLLDQIHVIGSFLNTSRFTIVVSGPPFGYPRILPLSPRSRRFFRDFRVSVLKKYDSVLLGT